MSPIDTAHANPALATEYIKNDTFYFIGNTARYKWKIKPEALPYLKDIEIYSYEELGIEPTLVKTFHKDSLGCALPFSYKGINYYAQANLINGYGSMPTTPILVQFPDSIPSAAPQTPQGLASSDGRVDLSWAQNTEPDLLGYNVYYANENLDSSTYTRVNGQPILEANLSTYINTAMSLEMIYYKVTALDHRYNESPMSAPAMLERPDNTDYIAAITNLNPQPQGIRVAWEESNPLKVVKYILERKPSAIPTWTKVREWKPDSIGLLPLIPLERVAPRYIDTATLEKIEYTYRIVSIAKSGVKSYSDERKIQPYDDGNRGVIGGLRLAPTGARVDDNNNEYLIGWNYATKYEANIKEFKIYVRYNDTSDPNFYLINTINAQASNNRANFGGSSPKYSAVNQLPKSNANLLPSAAYSFRIVAHHRDGGFSVFTGNAGGDVEKEK